MRPDEKPLIDRVKDYASSVHVQETPWLDILMNDVIVEIERLRRNLETRDHFIGKIGQWQEFIEQLPK